MTRMQERLSTGVDGLDSVLGGGLFPGSSLLVRGAAGTGKTTLGLQFLCEGARHGEGGVYVSFEEFPEQIYRDARSMGMDLPALEQAGKLQIVTIAPEVFMQEAVAPDGLLEELRNEIGMQRIVIDSVTLLENALANAADGRRSIYLLRNALRRRGISTLLIEEGHPALAASSTNEYVVDTVIHMTFDDLEKHRLRHLEVRKHRGSSFRPGRHVFVIGESGIRLLPALDVIPDLTTNEVVPTGLPKLDQCLGGGIPRGSVFVLNVNSKSNYRFLAGSIIAAHLQQGDGYITGRAASPPAAVAGVMTLYGFDAAALGAEGRWNMIEFTDRPAPPQLEPYIVRVPDDPDSHQAAVNRIILTRMRGEVGNARHWICMTDMNTVLNRVGERTLIKQWSELIGHAGHYGHTLVAICNFEEMGAPMASFLQRTATGILRTWFDGRYQYLQVQKAPNGRVSEPMVIEYTDNPPYMVLW